jgi:hypothetical protein
MAHPSRARVGHMAQQTLVPAAARNTSGNGTVSAWWKGRPTAAQARLSITAASGTGPQLTLIVDSSPDQTAWTTRDTFPVQNTTATVTRALPAIPEQFIRFRWTIAGTNPSFTFSDQVAKDVGSLL